MAINPMGWMRLWVTPDVHRQLLRTGFQPVFEDKAKCFVKTKVCTTREGLRYHKLVYRYGRR